MDLSDARVAGVRRVRLLVMAVGVIAMIVGGVAIAWIPSIDTPTVSSSILDVLAGVAFVVSLVCFVLTMILTFFLMSDQR